MTRLLFARVGWMKEYKGQQTHDAKPVGGGAYNETKLGYETFNFLPTGDGRVLGYVQPPSDSISLERIEPGCTEDALAGVLVVWVATHAADGQRIVGWYRNATVLRNAKPRPSKEHADFYYNVEAKSGPDYVVLIREARRSCGIPFGKGAMGQANVYYSHEDDGTRRDASWMRAALKWIEEYRP